VKRGSEAGSLVGLEALVSLDSPHNSKDLPHLTRLAMPPAAKKSQSWGTFDGREQQ
jgi:hypothetical protein